MLCRKRLYEFLIYISIMVVFEMAIMIKFGYQLQPLYYLLTIASIIIIPGMIVFLKSSRTRFIMYSIFIFIGLALFVTNSCLYYFKEDLFSFAMFNDIGDGIKMGIKYNIFAAFKLWQWIIIFALTIAGISLLKRISLGKNYSKNKMPFQFALIFISSILILISSNIFIADVDQKIYDSPHDKRTYLHTFGISSYLQRDAFNTITHLLSQNYQRVRAGEQLRNIEFIPTPDSTVTGELQGKNLIMIMMETVEYYAIDEQLTPTLYNLLNDGYHFTNTYASAKFNYTYDAEFKALTSMMYFRADNLMHTFAENEFTNALPFVLRDHGYTTNSFHSFYSSYFNRDNMHIALGFDSYLGLEDMSFSEYDVWPLDSELFAQNKDKIAPVQDDPFFSFVITLTPHGPHAERRSELQNYYQQIENDGRFNNHEEDFINFLATHMDFDYALEILIDDLQEKQILDDTVIVLFSDHKNYSSFEMTQKYTPDIKTLYDYDIIPFAIYNPSINQRTINYMTSQYDITPTILDLFGIKVNQEFYYGQSVFLYDLDKYQIKPNILGYNRWIYPQLIVYDKKVLYADPSINDVDKLYLEIQKEVYETIEKFHAFLIADYFRRTAIE